MDFRMSHAFTVFLYTFALFLGMLLLLEIGWRIAVRRMKEDGGAAGEGVGAIMARSSRCLHFSQRFARRAECLIRAN
jgi:hypothetical protein